jgi:hypothetical protein
VGKTLSGVKSVAGKILHPVNYATRSIVTLVLNPMQIIVLGTAKFVKHVFVVNAEWKSVTS